MDYNKVILSKKDNLNYHKVLMKEYRALHNRQASEFSDLLDESHIAITHKGLSSTDTLFESPMEVAVLATIGSFNSLSKDRLMSNMVSVEMILSRLMYRGNMSRKRKDVKKSISQLQDKEIISVTDMFGNPISDIEKAPHTLLMNIKQEMTGKFSYYRIRWSEFLRVVSSDASDSNKEHLLSVLCSVKSYMNEVGSYKKDSVNDLSLLNHYRGMFCLSTIESIGAKVGLARMTASKYLDELKKMSIIKSLKVHREHTPDYSWSYYYSDFARFDELTYFAENLIKSGFVSNSKDGKYKDFSYLNIDKVYNEDFKIVKDGRKFKIKDD